MNFLKQIAFVALTSSIAACQKQDNTPAQPDKVVITISSPADAQVLKKGDVVKIQGNISYISQLHGYQVTIKNKDTGKELFSHYEHLHTDNFNFNTQWVDTLSEACTLQLTISAGIDHDGNSGTKELTLQSQP